MERGVATSPTSEEIAGWLGLGPGEIAVRVTARGVAAPMVTLGGRRVELWSVWLVYGLVIGLLALAAALGAWSGGQRAALICALGAGIAMRVIRRAVREARRAPTLTAPRQLLAGVDGLDRPTSGGVRRLRWAEVEQVEPHPSGGWTLAVGGERLVLSASPESHRLAEAAHQVLLARRAAEWREEQVPERALSFAENADVDAERGLSRAECNHA